ncbi:MAG: sigma-70 family RNA polymerase sigma factor [Victivallales bacterium]
MEETIKTEDSDLVKGFMSGSESAYDELVRKYSVHMYNVAFGLLGSHEDAEEVVQDGFVKAYSNLKTFRGDSTFSTWLYRIVVNLARNKYHWNRRRGSGQNISISENRSVDDEGKERDLDIPDTSSAPGREIESSEEDERIMNAINGLPDALKEVIVLRHIKDMSYEEISKITGANIGTVKSRISRARETLSEILKK